MIEKFCVVAMTMCSMFMLGYITAEKKLPNEEDILKVCNFKTIKEFDRAVKIYDLEQEIKEIKI